MRFPPIPSNPADPVAMRKWMLGIQQALQEFEASIEVAAVPIDQSALERQPNAPYEFDGDVIITDSSKGFVVYDTGTSTYQRLSIVSGTPTTADTGSPTPPGP